MPGAPAAGSGERAYRGGLSARLTFRASWSAGDDRIPGCAAGGDPSFHKQLYGLLSCASARLAPWYWLLWTPFPVHWPETAPPAVALRQQRRENKPMGPLELQLPHRGFLFSTFFNSAVSQASGFCCYCLRLHCGIACWLGWEKMKKKERERRRPGKCLSLSLGFGSPFL